MNPNENPMTIKDVLTDVTKVLGDINVPASKIEEIGIPIAKAINGIKACIDAMNRDEEERAKKETVLEVVKDENAEGENDA